jgi:predicted N-formylglutamate amidohydrolase
MIEVRNDLLRTVKDISAWAERLAGAILEGADVIGTVAAQASAGR